MKYFQIFCPTPLPLGQEKKNKSEMLKILMI